MLRCCFTNQFKGVEEAAAMPEAQRWKHLSLFVLMEAIDREVNTQQLSSRRKFISSQLVVKVGKIRTAIVLGLEQAKLDRVWFRNIYL